MSDRSGLFGFSVLMLIGAVAVAVLIAVSGHVGFDEVFLLAVCGVTAFAFGVYVVYLLRQAAARSITSTQAPPRTAAAAVNAAEHRPAA